MNGSGVYPLDRGDFKHKEHDSARYHPQTMRGIGRWMLNALTALSLLLCVGTCVLWVRGYWRYDRGYDWEGDQANCIALQRGTFRFSRLFAPRGYPGVNLDWRWESFASSEAGTMFARYWFAGFGYRDITVGDGSREIDLTVPYWFVFVLTVALPGLVAYWRWRRPRAGRCDHCDYDLTGNVSGVCPECGREVQSAEC